MEYLFTQVEYEQQGYRKGTSAKVISTGEVVLLVSNPKVENQKVFVWVAMEDDTYVRYLVNVNDLQII
jgi:hypothetical protein